MIHETSNISADDSASLRSFVRPLLRSARWIIPISLAVGLMVGAYAERLPKLYSSSAVISTWLTEPGMLSAKVLDNILASLPPSSFAQDRRRTMLAEDISVVRARNQSLKPGDRITMAVTVYRNEPAEAKMILDRLIKAWTEMSMPSATRKQKYETRLKELTDSLAVIRSTITKYETDQIAPGAGDALASLYTLQAVTVADINDFKEKVDGVSEDEIVVSPATTPDFGRDKYPMAGLLAGLLTALLLTALSAAMIALRISPERGKGSTDSTSSPKPAKT